MSVAYANWQPGWYELDQPLRVGERREFVFFRSVPNELSSESNGKLVFYNTLLSDRSNAMRAEGTVASIQSRELGEVLEVDTKGLDYTIRLANGAVLTVNAEEEPGVLYENHSGEWIKSARQVSDWIMTVGLEDLGQLVPLTMDWKPRRHGR